MLKFQITNVSDRPRFLTEAGKLLRPGDTTSVNRLDQTTRNDPAFQIEEGSFAPPSPVIKQPSKPVEDDDEDDVPMTKQVDDGRPGQLVDAKVTSRIVPLEAVTSSEQHPWKQSELAPPVPGATITKTASSPAAAEDDAPLAVDELENEVAKADKGGKADKADKGGKGGLVTRSNTDPATGR